MFKSIKESLQNIIKENNKNFKYNYIMKSGNIDSSKNIENMKKELDILIEDFNNVFIQTRNQSKKLLEENISKEKDQLMKEINSIKDKSYRENVDKLNLNISTAQNESINESIRKMEQNLEEEKNKVLQKVPFNNRYEAENKSRNSKN